MASGFQEGNMIQEEESFVLKNGDKINYADFFALFQEFSIDNTIAKPTKNILFSRIMMTLEEYGYNIKNDKEE